MLVSLESNDTLSHNSTRILSALCALVLLAACSCGGASPPQPPGTASGIVRVVAAENFWGSIAAQVGGSSSAVTSIIASPDADPHDYEPTARDARTIADAQYVISNGVGYDPWMDKLIAANPAPGRKVLVIGDYLGKKKGDNPHLWYSPEYVKKVAGKMGGDLKEIAPAGATALDASLQQFLTVGLKDYDRLIAEIKATYGGTKVGATESIFAYVAPALGLDLATPDSYLNAVSEGRDVSAADEAAMERQIDQKQIAILVYNSQNTPGNVQVLLQKAKNKGIPTPTITETPDPATMSFQDWQVGQLQGIKAALQKATGK